MALWWCGSLEGYFFGCFEFSEGRSVFSDASELRSATFWGRVRETGRSRAFFLGLFGCVRIERQKCRRERPCDGSPPSQDYWLGISANSGVLAWQISVTACSGLLCRGGNIVALCGPITRGLHFLFLMHHEKETQREDNHMSLHSFALMRGSVFDGLEPRKSEKQSRLRPLGGFGYCRQFSGFHQVLLERCWQQWGKKSFIGCSGFPSLVIVFLFFSCGSQVLIFSSSSSPRTSWSWI